MENQIEEIVKNVIINRRSIRTFSERKVSHEDILDLIMAGIWAPSGSNSQNQRFLIIDQKMLQKIAEARRLKFIKTAPHAVVVFTDSSLTRSDHEKSIWAFLNSQNASASIENMLVLATAKGLASCWISFHKEFDGTRVLQGSSWREVFFDYEIPSKYEIQGMVLIGYPKSDASSDIQLNEQHGFAGNRISRKPIEHYLMKGR